MPDVVLILIRSVVAFLTLLVMTRFMGKKQISQMTMFDYVVGITIGSIAAAMSVDQNVTMLDGVVSTLIWGFFTIMLGAVSLKSYRFRKLMEGEPVILVQRGKVLEDNLRKARMDATELLENLRENRVFDLAEVEFAVLEKNGQLSVMKKTDMEPVTPRDLRLGIQPRREPRIVIMDGNVMHRTLTSLGYSEQWLLDQIRQAGAKTFSDVFLAQVDGNGQVHVDLFQDNLPRQKS